MKHYKYNLVDFLKEATDEEKDTTKQFYNGDSDTGAQAGKPDAKDTQGDYNLKQVANAVAAAVKSHTDAKAKLDAKNLSASGKLKVKAGKNVSVSGEAEIDFRTGKADVAIPLKIKDKEVNLNIAGLDVANPKNIYGKEIKGVFIDPESDKEITLGVTIDPSKDKYSFTAGETKDRFSFDVSLNINKTDVMAGGSVGFDSRDFIPSKFAPKVNVGVEYDNSGGLSGNITAKKDFKTRTGTVGISGQGTVGGGERAVGVGVSYTPDKKKKASDDKVDKIATKGMKKAVGYVDTKKGYGQKMVKDKEGKKVTKAQKDVESAAVKVRKATEKIKENKVIMTKKELNFLIEYMLKN